MKHTQHLLKYVGLVILGIFLIQVVQAQQLMPSGNYSNVKISLNGKWKFKLYPTAATGADSAFFLTHFDTRKWADIKVPGHWELQGFSKPYYGKVETDGIGLYRRNFDVPASWKGKPVFIAFDGVLFGYTVWVNGRFAGEFASAFNRHTFDITQLVTPGKTNVIAVRVNKLPRAWKFDIFDCWSISGIYRDVTIYSLPNVYINDLVVKTTHVSDESARLSISTVINQSAKAKFSKNINVSATLKDAWGKTVGEWGLRKGNTFGQSLVFAGETEVLRPLLWTAEKPNLYTLEVVLKDRKRVLQSHVQRVGIREVTWDNAVLKLNGKPVKLRGVNYHNLSPVNGRAVTESEFLKDLKLMREANINYIRTSHYPPSPRLLELTDSLGFYVMDEVPFGWGEEDMNKQSFLPELLTRAQATVERDKNHPSVIIWSIGNENPFTPITHQAGKRVKELDDTRPVCHPQVGSYFGNQFSKRTPLPDSLDILSPHYPRSSTLKSWSNRFDRPMIITEYAHSFGLDFGSMEEQWEIMYASPKLAGGSVWHFFDQGILRKADRKISRNDYTEYVWPDSLTYYDTGEIREGVDGLVYADRIPQVDYWQVRKVYSPVMPLGDSLTYDSKTGKLSFRLNNRYDFTDLSEINCEWKFFAGNILLDSGLSALKCAPHDTVWIDVFPKANKLPEADYYMLKLAFTDRTGYQFSEKVYEVVPDGNRKSCLMDRFAPLPAPFMPVGNAFVSGENVLQISADEGQISLKSSDGKPLITAGPYARINRKPTMASRKLGEFLLKKSTGKKSPVKDSVQHVQYEFAANKGDKTRINGEITYAFLKNGYIEVRYDLKPDTSLNTNFTEAGVSFLLPARMTEFRWIGDGPYASYPDKKRLNEFGFHHLNSGDIHFQGNRANVDCAVFTDAHGIGVMLLANRANIAVERTQEGILISHNAFVSGRFNKGNDPELFYSFEKIGSLKGSFVIVPLDGNWNREIRQIFGNPNKTAVPFNPYYNSYDQN